MAYCEDIATIRYTIERELHDNT